MADREDMIRKVQALWNKADDKSVGDEERAALVEKARELMAKWTIDELVLAEATATEEAIVVADILLFKDEQVTSGNSWDVMVETTTLVPDQRLKLAHYIAMHHRCVGIVTHLPGGVDENGKIVYAGKYMRIVGYKGDTQSVRLLYQALGFDMIAALSDEMLDPKVHKITKKKQDRLAYQAEFCDGFASRVEERLEQVEWRIAQMAAEVSTGSLLPAMRSRLQNVQDKVTQMYGKLNAVEMRRFQLNPNARRRGAAAADQADIGGPKLGGGAKGIGEGAKALEP